VYRDSGLSGFLRYYLGVDDLPIIISYQITSLIESASRPLVGFGVLNDNLIKCLISFVEVHEQILSNRYKSIHGYITRSTIMMQMELSDQCV
jgi:hypothetical protein